MKRIFVILIYLIVVILFIYTIIKINNNDNKKLIVRKPLTSSSNNYVSYCNNISEPTIVLNSFPHTYTQFYGPSINPVYIDSQYESYTFDASHSYDYDGTKNLSFYWSINWGTDEAATLNKPYNFPSLNYNGSTFTIPVYNNIPFLTSFQLILTVKSNYKPFLKKIITRDIFIYSKNLHTYKWDLIISPNINININNVQPINVDNAITIRTQSIYGNNIGPNTFITTINVLNFDGFITNDTFYNNAIWDGTYFNLSINPFQVIPNTKGFLLVRIRSDHKIPNYWNFVKPCEKYISIPLRIPINKKFNANLSYNNLFNNVINNVINNKWNYWDIGENPNLILNTNVVDTMTDKRPTVNDLVFKWEIISDNNNNNNITASNLNSSTLAITYRQFTNLYYKFYKIICNITFGQFSIPMILETPDFNIIKRDLIGVSTGNYVNYLVYNNISKFNFQYTEYLNSSNQIVGIRINNPLNNFYDSTSRFVTQEIKEEFINNSPLTIQTSNNIQTITTTSRFSGLYYFKIIKYLDKNIMGIYPVSSDNIEGSYGVYSYKVIS